MVNNAKKIKLQQKEDKQEFPLLPLLLLSTRVLIVSSKSHSAIALVIVVTCLYAITNNHIRVLTYL